MPVVGPIGVVHQVISFEVYLGVEPGVCEVRPAGVVFHIQDLSKKSEEDTINTIRHEIDPHLRKR